MRDISRNHSQSRSNKNQTENYFEIFFEHARLYVFVDEYDIQSLKFFAMKKLHTNLIVFILHQQRTNDIVSLLRYIYEKTSETKIDVENSKILMIQ